MFMKRLSRVFTVVVLGILLMGGFCEVRTAPPDAIPTATPRDTMPAQEQQFDIGDAEAALSLKLMVPEPAPANFEVDEMWNLRGDLDLITVSVHPPHPRQLLMELTIESRRAFGDRPLLVHLTVFRDREPVDRQTVTVADNAITHPFSYELDMLEGLDETPATMLAHAEARIIMLPPGTDVAEIDPETVTGTTDTTGAKVSNPVRVTFVGGEDETLEHDEDGAE